MKTNNIFHFFVYRIVKVNGKFVKLCNPIVWNYLLSISARKIFRCFSTHMFIWKQTVRNRKYIMRVWRFIIRFFSLSLLVISTLFQPTFFLNVAPRRVGLTQLRLFGNEYRYTDKIFTRTILETIVKHFSQKTRTAGSS